MQKSFNIAAKVLAAGAFLLGNAFCVAQQTPAATTQTAPAKAQASGAQKSTTPRAKSSTTAKTTAPLALKTQKDKFSYALGMNLGTNLHKQSVPIDPSIMARGLRDALAGGKLLLTEEEARTAITAVQNNLRQQQQAKMQAAGEENKKVGESFLAQNKGKEGVVVLPSGLQYKVLQAGAGPKPAVSDTVVCNYRGTLINGTEFDSSTKHGGPATFPVNGVIKGWTEALQLMPVGSKWQLFIPSDLAYGDRGAGNEIGPGATLIFEVELVSIQNKSEEKKPETNPESKPDVKPETKPDAPQAKPDSPEAKPEIKPDNKPDEKPNLK
jgi:FKBP-type peptidyl-prolyl cis-trans isomerase